MRNKTEPATAAPTHEQLSSMMDGELGPEHLGPLLDRWSHDADMRERWHVYHLVGDALRSDDLAMPPQRDQDFLATLRQRLAAEPVPLAPAPLLPAAPPARPASRWLHGRRLIAPVAVAAGVVAVVSGLLVLRGNPGDGGAQLAVAPRDGATVAPGTNVIRDTRLDRYMQAHRTQGNGFGAMAAGGTQFQIVYEPE